MAARQQEGQLDMDALAHCPELTRLQKKSLAQTERGLKELRSSR